jgi:hypothetical protein
VNEQSPLPWTVAAVGEARCIFDTIRLLAGGCVHQPSKHIGMRLHFANGTSARVYRETVVEGAELKDPCVLVVQFRLRLVRGWWHTAFRWESLLNTPLFVGFPGYATKLWLAHDEHDFYRGVYDWDGADRAEHYARSLWRVLQIGCVPASIGYRVLPGLRRDDLLAQPSRFDPTSSDPATAWWQPVSVE